MAPRSRRRELLPPWVVAASSLAGHAAFFGALLFIGTARAPRPVQIAGGAPIAFTLLPAGRQLSDVAPSGAAEAPTEPPPAAPRLPVARRLRELPLVPLEPTSTTIEPPAEVEASGIVDVAEVMAVESEADERRSGLLQGMLGFGIAPRAPVVRDRAELATAGEPSSEPCESVDGVWVGLVHDAGLRVWNRFTLRMRRHGEQLEGEILAQVWTGDDTHPPPCEVGSDSYRSRMHAQGWVRGDRMVFTASAAAHVEEECGDRHGYGPQQFSGEVHAEDGVIDGIAHGAGIFAREHVTFRRARCLEE